MQVKEVMCTGVKVIRPDTTLREAAAQMRDCDCGYLPVGENDRLTGALTDRDIIIRGVAAGLDPDTATVGEVMTGRIEYCFENDDVRDAAQHMKSDQIRRLAVLNQGKRLTGVVTLGDIARECGDRQLTGDIEQAVAKAA